MTTSLIFYTISQKHNLQSEHNFFFQIPQNTPINLI